MLTAVLWNEQSTLYTLKGGSTLNGQQMHKMPSLTEVFLQLLEVKIIIGKGGKEMDIAAGFATTLVLNLNYTQKLPYFQQRKS